VPNIQVRTFLHGAGPSCPDVPLTEKRETFRLVPRIGQTDSPTPTFFNFTAVLPSDVPACTYASLPRST
jgi:hypothetical protein